MSKLSETFGKLKGKASSTSSSSSVGSFRFNKAEDEILQVYSLESSTDYNSVTSDTSEQPPLISKTDQNCDASSNEEPRDDRNNYNEMMTVSKDDENYSIDSSSSPVKDVILTKFGKLTTNPIENQSTATVENHHYSVDETMNSGTTLETAPANSSWLNQMKGRITKTVEEKYTEYKNEKERKKLSTSSSNQTCASVDFQPEDNNEIISSSSSPIQQPAASEDYKKMSQSQSENIISSSSSSSDHHHQPFEMDVELNSGESDIKTPKVLDLASSPPRERRKFNFSFRSSPAKALSTTTSLSSSPTTTTGIPTNEDQLPIITSTPTKTSTLKQRMMVLMGKSSSTATTPTAPPQSAFNDEEFTEIGGDEVEEDEAIETAVEADEMFDPSRPGSVIGDDQSSSADTIRYDSIQADNHSITNTLIQYKWKIVFPLLILILVQILPVHPWMTGLITGLLIGVISAFYLSLKLFQEDIPPRTKFLENTSIKKMKKLNNAIIVQEEMEKKEVWMNLWPSKYGQYDPLTYDVRRTVSVRVELYGSWLELRFPKRNIPLRRMFDEVEPHVETMAFYEHKEVIDLTTARISLLPESLPSKRMWSKKYPIEIKTNARKFKTSNVPKSESNDDIFDDALEDTTTAMNNDPYDLDKVRVEPTEPTNSFLMIPNEDSKTYYLFARTGREKEEWYSRLRVAAKFMDDWNHQNPEPGAQIDPDYVTFKQKEQTFKLFMEDYLQSKTIFEAHMKHDETRENNDRIAKEQLSFINIFGARMWFDLYKSVEFVDFLKEKITRKLLKIKIAQYFEEVSVTTLDLGQKVPEILSASLPWQDESGLWVDLEFEYFGLCQAEIQTQGIRLPGKDEPLDREAHELSRQAAVLDSDEEDSAEEDDDVTDNDINDAQEMVNEPPLKGTSNEKPSQSGSMGSGGGGGVGGVGFKARMLDSLLKSDLLAKVAETEWVKKNITGKNITLQLQLHAIKGILTLNFPPDPSDRIWYGFRTPPTLDIALKPCFGGKSLDKYENTFSTVMKLLEKRLKMEFMKVLVFPNMDDEVIPFMNHVPYSITN